MTSSRSLLGPPGYLTMSMWSVKCLPNTSPSEGGLGWGLLVCWILRREESRGQSVVAVLASLATSLDTAAATSGLRSRDMQGRDISWPS